MRSILFKTPVTNRKDNEKGDLPRKVKEFEYDLDLHG